MEHLSSDQEDHLNQHENSHKLCIEKGHTLLSLKEIQCKLSDQNCRNERKGPLEQILALDEINKTNSAGL